MKRTFAAIVQRTSKWDQSKTAQEQAGFAAHAKYMGDLEAEGFITLAGLMQDTFDVLFILEADSKEQVDARLAADPWRQDGHTRLLRLEELVMRPNPPKPAGA
jgi:uncharacterized protein YciI